MIKTVLDRLELESLECVKTCDRLYTDVRMALDAAQSLGLLSEGTSIRLDRGYDAEAIRKKLRTRGQIPEI